MVVEGRCPEAEELGAFIDGTLTGPAAEAVREHLVECSDCYEVFSGSVKFLQREQGTATVLTSSRFRRRKLLYAAAATVAAAAAVVFVLRTPLLQFNRGISSEEGTWTWVLEERVEQLQQGGSTDFPLSDALWQPSENVLAFAGSMSPQKRAFQLGVQLVDLEISLRENRSRAASGALDRISFLVEPLDVSAHVTDMVDESKDRLGTGGPARELSGLSSSIDSAVQAEVDEIYFSLGKWAEAGRLAALSENTSYFEDPRHKEYVQAFQRLDLPPEVHKELGTIEGLLQEPETNLETLERSLTQIILVH